MKRALVVFAAVSLAEVSVGLANADAPEEINLADLLSVSPDDDGDTVPNLIDNCAFVANGNQADANQNGVGDVCDPASPPVVGFDGFFQPIDMSTPSLIVWNNVNAGKAVPVKWRLTLVACRSATATALRGSSRIR